MGTNARCSLFLQTAPDIDYPLKIFFTVAVATDERDITRTQTQFSLPLTLGYQILVRTPRTASWYQFYHAYNAKMLQCREAD